jgi:hypothetical protein
MKYAIEIGSCDTHTRFHKIGSGVQKLMGGIHRQHEDRINLL